MITSKPFLGRKININTYFEIVFVCLYTQKKAELLCLALRFHTKTVVYTNERAMPNSSPRNSASPRKRPMACLLYTSDAADE